MGILINVFIVLSIVMLVVSSLFESTVLQIKMTARFKQQAIEWREAEERLTRLEENIEKTEFCDASHCALIEFVPDALLEIETSGVGYYNVRDKLQSTFALRKQRFDGVNSFEKNMAWIDIAALAPGTVIGRDFKREGVRLYVVSSDREEKYNALFVFQWVPEQAPKLIYVINEKTIFGMPCLWHEYIVIEKIPEKKLVIYQASTGEKMQELPLKQEPLALDYPLCGTRPVVLVRAPRERKRKIIVTHNEKRWFAEADLDFDLLGRRTEDDSPPPRQSRGDPLQRGLRSIS